MKKLDRKTVKNAVTALGAGALIGAGVALTVKGYRDYTKFVEEAGVNRLNMVAFATIIDNINEKHPEIVKAACDQFEEQLLSYSQAYANEVLVQVTA